MCVCIVPGHQPVEHIQSATVQILAALDTVLPPAANWFVAVNAEDGTSFVRPMIDPELIDHPNRIARVRQPLLQKPGA